MSSRTGDFMGIEVRKSAAAAVGIVLAGLVALLVPASAAADTVVNPGNTFNAAFTGGQITIGSTLPPIDVGTLSPAPRLRNINVAADGGFTADKADLTFPQILLPVDAPVVGTIDIGVQIRAATDPTGHIDPQTGEITLDTSLTIQLTSTNAIVALGTNCYVGSPASPIPFHATSGPTTGTPYDEYTGLATVEETTFAVPVASGCPTIFGNNVNDLVNSQLGLPSPSGNNQASFDLKFNPAPHSADWVDPEGPGNVEPTIVNDTPVEVESGVEERSWLESFAISDGNITARQGNTVRMSLLVRHNPGRSVTGLRIDDNWDGNDDSDGSPVKAVTAEMPVVAGGFNYSRVTFEYQAPSAGMGLTCPDLFGGDGILKRTSQISVRAVLDNGTESESSTSPLQLSREDCNAKIDPPMIYGWDAGSPPATLLPNESATFKFRGDDTDQWPTDQNKFGGYTWRARNLDTGETTSPTFVCPGVDQDNVLQTLNVTFPDRGRWVVETKLHNLDGDIFGNGTCSYTFAPNHWYWVGAVDVNSPVEASGVYSPAVGLSVPARPDEDGSLALSVNGLDTLDASDGGKVQSVEWDLDGNSDNGYERVRLGDSRTGLNPGQNQTNLDTTSLSPGIYTARVRVGDNGALGAADSIRRTNTAEADYMVNTPPTAGDLAVETPEGAQVATPLVAADTNADDSHDPLTWTVKTPPAHGFLSGEWPDRSYNPDSGFSGTDSFVFEVNDGFGGTATGTVTITVKKADVSTTAAGSGHRSRPAGRWARSGHSG
ncbi:MAG: hypothetical protein IPK93_02595 [Solirubrobacterales bacterium]|nr:hypothetical protein [Solirubrobacterales bacterium]